MTVSVHEFIRRFMLHLLLLLDCFVMIRHYGILENKNIGIKLEKYKKLLSSCDNTHFYSRGNIER